MAIKPNGDERNFGADRERQREVSNENGRSVRASNGESVARGDAAPESGSTTRGRSNRGFASMDRSKQREIASKGGRAAHQKGTAHEFDSSEARAAGRKGGVTVSKNREHMAAIGRRGGEARGANRAARVQGDDSEHPSGNGQRGSSFQADREVGFASESQSAGNRGGQGTARQSGNSLGGERSATAVITPERNIERP